MRISLRLLVERPVDTEAIISIAVVKTLNIGRCIAVDYGLGSNRTAHKVVFVNNSVYSLFVPYTVRVILVTYTRISFGKRC